LTPSQVQVTPAAVNCCPFVGAAGKSIMVKAPRSM
jgi:hypothetical protein